MILMIDNYDSFTWNLVHLIGTLGHEVEVVRNDQLTVEQALDRKAEAIVISPGPGRPESAGLCLDLIRAAEAHRQPIFGVCLGLQSMAEALGGKVIQAQRLMHGKISTVHHENTQLFTGIPQHFTATRYHSLVADPGTLPACFRVTARTDDDSEIMAIEHKTQALTAVQFHPESISSEYGAQLFKNFMEATKS